MSCHVMLYNMCCVMLCHITCVVSSYITCVMSYNTCHVMLYNIKYVMLYNIKYVMLCYDMKIVFYFNAIVKIPFYLVWVRNIKLPLFIKQIINFSVEETLFI